MRLDVIATGRVDPLGPSARGAERALVEVTERLARTLDVHVWTQRQFGGMVGRVMWHGEVGRNGGMPPDALGCPLVLWRLPHFLATATARWPDRPLVVWSHEVTADDLELASQVWALSHFHADRLPTHPNKVLVPNGVDPDELGPLLDARLPIALYHSSPQRGLERLLHLWPRIQREVPSAELHVAYGDEPLLDQGGHATGPWRLPAGAVWRGSLPRHDLLALLRTASAWLYPHPPDGSELFCIAAVEAVACGLETVCFATDALPEVLGEVGIPSGEFPKDDDAFVAQAVAALRSSDRALSADRRRAAIKARLQFSWDRAALLAARALRP